MVQQMDACWYNGHRLHGFSWCHFSLADSTVMWFPSCPFSTSFGSSLPSISKASTRQIPFFLQTWSKSLNVAIQLTPGIATNKSPDRWLATDAFKPTSVIKIVFSSFKGLLQNSAVFLAEEPLGYPADVAQRYRCCLSSDASFHFYSPWFLAETTWNRSFS